MFSDTENKIPNILDVQKSNNEKHKPSFYPIMVIWADLIDEVQIDYFCLSSGLSQCVLKVSHSFYNGACILFLQKLFWDSQSFLLALWFSHFRLIRRDWVGCCDLELGSKESITIKQLKYL